MTRLKKTWNYCLIQSSKMSKKEKTHTYKSKRGMLIQGNSIELLQNDIDLSELKGKVNLIITSPPFPLNNKKQYGNEKGEEYKDWFIKLAPIFSDLLADDGSLVIEIGNAWEPERPVQSLLHLECLLGMVNIPKRT